MRTIPGNVLSLQGLRDIMQADNRAEPHRSDRLTVHIFRFGQYAYGRRSRAAARIVYLVLDFVWVRCIVGAELPPSASIGPGLRLRHWGRGIILHRKTVLGSNASLYHRVTIGESHGGKTPVIGDDFYAGTGSTILGGIVVGDGVKVGAGAVLVKDVGDNEVVVGAPARNLGSSR